MAKNKGNERAVRRELRAERMLILRVYRQRRIKSYRSTRRPEKGNHGGRGFHAEP